MFLIGEIGINHNGDVEVAKKIITAAKDSGFDAVKFQKRTIEKVYSQQALDTSRESPWGKTTREQKLGLEFEKPQFDEIDRFCKATGIAWFASAWDVDSLRFLQGYDLAYNKIAGPMTTKLDFIEECSKMKKTKTFISNGMTTGREMNEVLCRFIEKENLNFSVMHCVSSYPTKAEDLFFGDLESGYYNIVVDEHDLDIPISGFSDHTIGNEAAVVAAYLGCSVIEKHITLDCDMYGSDQKLSLPASKMKDFVESVRKASKIFKGCKRGRLLECEKETRKKLVGA